MVLPDGGCGQTAGGKGGHAGIGGGGMWIYGNAAPRISNSDISSNNAAGAGGGVALASSAAFDHTKIDGNRAGTLGVASGPLSRSSRTSVRLAFTTTFRTTVQWSA